VYVIRSVHARAWPIDQVWADPRRYVRGKSGWTTRGLEENIRIQNGEELTSQGMASEAAGEDLFAPHGGKLLGSGHGGEGLTGRLSDETFECMHAWTTSLVASCKPHAHVYGHRS
jgi:hypothetical protein